MSRSTPAVRRQQRARRRARRAAAGLCLHGLCCPAPVAAPHVYCARHRTRQGRRGATPPK